MGDDGVGASVLARSRSAKYGSSCCVVSMTLSIAFGGSCVAALCTTARFWVLGSGLFSLGKDRLCGKIKINRPRKTMTTTSTRTQALVTEQPVLSVEERHRLVAAVRPKMARAIANPAPVDPVRSWIHVGDSSVASDLVQRVSELVGADPACCESPEIIYYRRGGRRVVVTELLDAEEPALRDFLDHGGQRVLTALVYLHEQYSGAGDHELEFLQPGDGSGVQRVRVEPGRCACFSNQDEAGRTVQYAVAAQPSDRWLAVLRFREGNFQFE